MKRIITLMFSVFSLTLFLCCGCAASESIIFSDEYISGQDSQYYYTFSEHLPMADTEEGYYFMNGEDCKFLYYRDMYTGETAQVCNKPECMHNDETCNAYLGSINTLLCYSDKIYYLDNKQDLYEVSLDGGKHNKILSFSEYVYYLAFHGEYVYYITTDFGTIANKEDETKTIMRFYRLPVEQMKSEPELLYEFQGIHANTGRLLCYGNYIYFFQGYYTDSSMEKHDRQINRYDIRYRKMDVVVKDCYGQYTVFNGQLAYVDPDATYICDLDGQNIRKVLDKTGILMPGSRYLLLDTVYDFDVMDRLIPRTVNAIDQEGNFVGSIELDGYRVAPIGVVDDMYFVPSFFAEDQLMSIYQIPVEKIADGTGQPEVFFEYVPEE